MSTFCSILQSTTTMATFSLVLLSFLCFLLSLASQATAKPQYNVCVTERGTFLATPTYRSNLNTLLANLTSNTRIDYGFYNLSYGQSPDKVTAIGLCRGDLKPDDCRRCLNGAREFLPQSCQDNKEAIAFYENCMLRYSNRSILGVVEDTPWYPRWDGINVTNVDQYNQTLNKLLTELRSEAASGDSRRKFAAGNATVTESQTIYGLVQCTPDLSEQLCIDCLGEAFSEISTCCNGVGNVTIGRPSCNVRYSTQRFYDATADTSTKAQTNISNIPTSQATAKPQYNVCVTERGTFLATPTYRSNLNTLLANLTSNTQIDYGFYNLSYGQSPDKVTAIGLCRGDLKPDDCRRCLNGAREFLPQSCQDNKEAIAFYENCMLRYSNRSILGVVEDTPWYPRWDGKNITNVDQYNQALNKLLPELRSEAASGDSRRKFAAGNATVTKSQTIYGLVQCTPDLSEQWCIDCLGEAFSEISRCCNSVGDVTIGRPSCNVRYSTQRFYDATADASTKVQTNTTTSTEEKSNTARTVILIVVSVVAFIILLFFVFICVRVKMTKKDIKGETKAGDEEIESIETLRFDFHAIEVATNNFADENKLGQGGFGVVYKGELFNGQAVAVKRLSKESGQGDIEFQNEVLLVAKLQHRNLVRLLGFCLERRERVERILIYEFVPNKSLDYFIFDPIQRFYLDWQKRYKIIEGIARGLLYLHEDSRLRIVHRDLKASNILLNQEMNPKISDFGMARLFQMDQSRENTNRIVGTHGYIAPEYATYGHFSVKSDIFSFGVLTLEIISGLKNSEIQEGSNIEHLVSFVWRNWREGTASNIADSTLNGGSTNEIMRCIHIGLLCVQENAANRPTMASVMLMLDSNSATLPKPTQPAFVLNGRGFTETQSARRNAGLGESANNDVQASANEASITELYAR